MPKRKPIRTKVNVPKKNTPRPLPSPRSAGRPREEFARQNKVLRNQAGTDFVVDDQGRSVRYHYERKDRLYSSTIGWPTFQRWAIEDRWVDRRTEFWRQMEERVIEHYSDKIFRARLKEMAKLEGMIESYEKYLMPLVDKETGQVKLDKNGLPVFALKMPTIEKFAEMYLKVHERLMLLRGEAISRSEQIGGGSAKSRVTAHTEDPVTATPRLNRYEARAMARALLHEREKKLALPSETKPEPESIETEGESSDDGQFAN